MHFLLTISKTSYFDKEQCLQYDGFSPICPKDACVYLHSIHTRYYLFIYITSYLFSCTFSKQSLQ